MATARSGLPLPVQPGETVRADDWNRLLETVAALVARSGPSGRRDVPDPARAVLLAEDVMIGYVAELKAPARAGVAELPSRVRYVLRARHVPSIVLDQTGPEGQSLGVLPDYGRPVRGDEARIYPQDPGPESLVVLLRVADGTRPGGSRMLSVVLGETVARRRCTNGA